MLETLFSRFGVNLGASGMVGPGRVMHFEKPSSSEHQVRGLRNLTDDMTDMSMIGGIIHVERGAPPRPPAPRCAHCNRIRKVDTDSCAGCSSHELVGAV